jgi:hypothetical protein
MYQLGVGPGKYIYTEKENADTTTHHDTKKRLKVMKQKQKGSKLRNSVAETGGSGRREERRVKGRIASETGSLRGLGLAKSVDYFLPFLSHTQRATPPAGCGADFLTNTVSSLTRAFSHQLGTRLVTLTKVQHF